MRAEQLLFGLKQAGQAILIASHDPHHFRRLADSGLVLHGGRLSPIDWDLRYDQAPEACVLTHYVPEKRHKPNRNKWKEDSRRVRR